MDEFQRTSLLMLAASIIDSDPWVMDATSCAVTLTPLRMMSGPERMSISDLSVLLDLTDLGRLGGTEGDRGALVTSPLRSQCHVVLLLPWSLLSSIAELDHQARTTSREIPRCYASDDWLTTWHHFIEGGDWELSDHDNIPAKCIAMLHSLPFEGSWHFVLASAAGSSSAIRSEIDLLQHSLQGSADGVGEGVTSRERALLAVDPLTFTNPGSAPEGLSPLFVTHHR